jgi:hypothetical protein
MLRSKNMKIFMLKYLRHFSRNKLTKESQSQEKWLWYNGFPISDFQFGAFSPCSGDIMQNLVLLYTEPNVAGAA